MARLSYLYVWTTDNFLTRTCDAAFAICLPLSRFAISLKSLAILNCHSARACRATARRSAEPRECRCNSTICARSSLSRLMVRQFPWRPNEIAVRRSVPLIHLRYLNAAARDMTTRSRSTQATSSFSRRPRRTRRSRCAAMDRACHNVGVFEPSMRRAFSRGGRKLQAAPIVALGALAKMIARRLDGQR
jgi:hypothetical protein